MEQTTSLIKCHSAVRQIEFMWNGFTQGISYKEGRTNQGNKALCEKRVHPNQKPVQLYKWLLKNYAKEGAKIFDSHMGSGSIALACYDFNCSLIACELDKDYHTDAVKRFKNHIAQQKLFA